MSSKSPLTLTEIQRKSDAKRGVKLKAFKLSLETIDEIDRISKATGKPNNALAVEAFELLRQKYGL